MKCSFYEREITPPLGQSMPGYYAERIVTGIADRLYAKVFAAENNGVKFAILVIDCAEIPTKYAEDIICRAADANGIPSKNISVVATHSHTAIPCGEPLVGLEDREYMNVLVRTAADCITLAFKQLRPAKIFYGCGEVYGISFNRNFVLKDGRVVTHLRKEDREGSHPYSDIDPLLPILTVKNQFDEPIGAIVNFACHQDCVGGSEYSGDYSSELSLQLKEHFGNDFVSLYIPGASGDINHVDYYSDSRTLDNLPHYRKMGRILAEEAINVIENSGEINGENISAQKEFLELNCRKATPEQIKNAEESLRESNGKDWLSAILLDYAKNFDQTVHPTPVQVFNMGEVSIAALPGEIFHKFAEQIRKECPQTKLLIATLANGAHGYVPTPELMETDIYEAKLCAGSFLEKDAGDKIIESAIKMINDKA